MKALSCKGLCILLLAGVLLSACSGTAQAPTPDQSLVGTIVVKTLVAELNQIKQATLAVLKTQTAIARLSPTLTDTPMVPPTPPPPMFTPTLTGTSTPVWTSTATITSTPTITSTKTVTKTPTITSTKTNTGTPTNTTTPTLTATVTPTVECNQATFVGDVTIPNGTSFVAGEIFTKTWRVKNTGSCSWTSSYSLVFSSGSSMSAGTTVQFSGTVSPGETLDLSVDMAAPANTGTYTGYWMIKDSAGETFGTGTSGITPLTITISVASVPASSDPYAVYDFVSNYCLAQWKTDAGNITCPSASYNYTNGAISRTYAPVLEDNTSDSEGTLITIPTNGTSGYLQGQYPKLLIHSGDYFKATLFCTYGKSSCDVTYELLYQEYGTNSATSLGTWEKTYDGTSTDVSVDLSSLDGLYVIFYLRVSSDGSSTDDFAQWMGARVTHP